MKRLSFSIILILLIIAASDMPQARVTGVCSNCHTMHNSQGGGPMAQTLTSPTWGWADDATPNPSLLMYSCVGCHTAVGSATTIVNDVPIVFNPSAGPGNPLAGGNFYYVENTNDNRGHNVLNTNQDGILGNTPPGGTLLSSQLTCAGEYGCHGDRTAGNDELAGIRGAHHTDDAVPLTGGTSVGKSYRFLKGILGKEDADWEQDNINTSHNEYKGPTTPPSSSDTTTISSLCGQCHENFHDQSIIGTASPWLRHPTDKVLNSSGEYSGYITYNMLAPVARPDPDSGLLVTTAVTPGTDIIMCLSCHRAHGSPNYKMIRWDYANSNVATALEGCGVCHTSKS